MKLVELEQAVDFYRPAPSIIYRVQRLRSRRGAAAVGALRVARRPTLPKQSQPSLEQCGERVD